MNIVRFVVALLFVTAVTVAGQSCGFTVNVSSLFVQLSQGTGIGVTAGTMVHFQATGTWCWGYPAFCSDANGTPGRPGPDEHPTLLDGPGYYFGQLIGRVVSGSTTTSYFLIGSSNTVVMPATGQLYLAMNERVGLDYPSEWYFDNRGSISVVVALLNATGVSGDQRCGWATPCCNSLQCCNANGYCGSAPSDCGTGCMNGPCTATTCATGSQRCGWATPCCDSSLCCNANGYCGSALSDCGTGCMNGPCNCATVSQRCGWATPCCDSSLCCNANGYCVTPPCGAGCMNGAGCSPAP